MTRRLMVYDASSHVTQNKTKAEGRFKLSFHCARVPDKRNRADRAEA